MLSSDDRRAIERLRATLRDAILDGDTAAYVGCFTADAFLMHQDSPYARGTESIKEHVQGVMDAVEVTRLDLAPQLVDGTDVIAYEVGVQDVEIHPPIDAFRPRRKHLHVYRRQADGEWKIAAAMSCND